LIDLLLLERLAQHYILLGGAAMKAPERRKLNQKIGEYLKPIYFDEIPLGGLLTILEDHGFRACDESGNRWQGFIVGREGWIGFPLKAVGSQLRHNNRLELMWYKMPSGRYEITSYVS
jgi:hypothetical protein